MKEYKKEFGFYFIDPENFSSNKIMEGETIFAREVFASPMAHKFGLYELLRHSSDEQLKELDDLMGNNMFYIWVGDIKYKTDDRPMYFDVDIEVNGKWFPVEKDVKEEIKLLISYKLEDKS